MHLSVLRSLIVTAIFSIILFFSFSSIAISAGTNWSRQDFTHHVTQLWGGREIKEQSAKGTRGEVFVLSVAEKPTCFVGEADTAWTLDAGPQTVSGPLTQIFVAGTDEKLHTVLIYFPIVAGAREDVEKAFEVIEGIFTHLVPDWKDADSWAKKSMQQSWEMSAKAFEDSSINRGDTIIQKQVSGVELTTFGIPPDYVLFRATTRAECVNIEVSQLAPENPPNAQAEPNERNGKVILDFNELQLDLDLSQTRYFLGSLGSSSTPFVISRGKLYANFIGDSPFEVDLADWLQANVPNGYGSLSEFIEDSPLPSAHQAYDIPFASPIRFNHNGIDYQLGHGRIMLQGKEQFDRSFNFEPSNAHFRVFASNIDPDLRLEVEASSSMKFVEYLQSRENREFFNFSSANGSADMPVDVTTAPHFVGYWMAGVEQNEQHLLVGGENDPAGYSIYLDRDDLVLQKVGEGQAKFAMNDWLNNQRIPLDHETRQSLPIFEPAIEIALNGSKYILVVSSVQGRVETQNGVANPLIRVFRGHLFGPSTAQ